MNKKRIVLTAFLSVLFLSADAKVVEKVLATVNDRAILLSYYKERRDHAMNALRKQYGASLTESKINEVDENLLTMITHEEMLFERARDLGIDTAQIIEQYFEEFKTQNKIENNEEFEELLSSEGMTLADFKEQIRRSIIPQLVIRREVAARVDISEEEAKKYFKENYADIKPSSRRKVSIYYIPYEREGAEAQGYALSERLQQGVARPDVIKEFSLEANQGIAETFRKGDLLPELDRVVFAMDPGAVSDPVPSEKGFYVIHILEELAEPDVSFDEVREKVFERAREAKFNSQIEKYWKELESFYFVEIWEKEPGKIR